MLKTGTIFLNFALLVQIVTIETTNPNKNTSPIIRVIGLCAAAKSDWISGRTKGTDYPKYLTKKIALEKSRSNRNSGT